LLARTLLSLVNLGVLGATLAVWFTLPQYANYALYACLGWVVVAFALMYSAWGNRPFGAPAPVGAGGASPAGAGGAPGSLAVPSLPPVDFCIYCATTLPVGASRCPACGHAAARG
jgi:hypothetical protein